MKGNDRLCSYCNIAFSPSDKKHLPTLALAAWQHGYCSSSCMQREALQKELAGEQWWQRVKRREA